MRMYLLSSLVVLAFAAVVNANDEDALRREVRQLRERAVELSGRATALSAEIESYLDQSSAWRGAQGDSLAGVTIAARFTMVNQNTVGLNPFNRSVVNGIVDLDFDFRVTDNLDLFIHLTANAPAGFEGDFNVQRKGANGPGVERSFGPIAGLTIAAVDDGLGVNGTVPTNPGSITTQEAGIHHRWALGEHVLQTEIGELDPRDRFLANAFAGDPQTQFVHNVFDDSSAVLWLTNASGVTSFGVHQWIGFGADRQHTVSWGWFNTPAQFFNRGQFYFQYHWKGEVGGREMNVRLMGFIDEFHQNTAGDGSTGGGASWDWRVTDTIGLFFLVGANGDNVASASEDFAVGAQFNGLVASRPDDVVGVAVGFVGVNESVLPVAEDLEVIVEIYYRYVAEEGKLQVTPHLIYVQDPGGGSFGWADDSLFLIGIRIHVPF